MGASALHMYVNGRDGKEIQRQKTLAIVGLSGKEARPEYGLARKMQRLGYKIIPVNPRETEILGERSFPSFEKHSRTC